MNQDTHISSPQIKKERQIAWQYRHAAQLPASGLPLHMHVCDQPHIHPPLTQQSHLVRKVKVDVLPS